MKSKRIGTTVMLLVVAACAAWASGATVGYWRFEDSPGFLEDSGPNNLDLTNNGGVQTVLPGSGNGSAFHDPVPQTGQGNAKAVHLGNESTPSRGDWLAVADAGAFSVTNFTVEGYFNKAVTMSGTAYIAAQWSGTGNQRSWALGVGGTSGTAPNKVFLLLSDAGSDTNVIDSGLTVTVGKDYFAAAVYNQSGGTVIFYLQNLTDGGTLTNASQSHSIASLHDSTASVRVGSRESASTDGWIGLIDEVRLSNTALSQNELLAVPEPASLAVVLLGAAGLVLRRRRQA